MPNPTLQTMHGAVGQDVAVPPPAPSFLAKVGGYAIAFGLGYALCMLTTKKQKPLNSYQE
jgi:hypothetical protein